MRARGWRLRRAGRLGYFREKGRGGEEEGVMSADNRRIDGSNDDFALLRRLLAEAVEEGRLRGYRARHAS